MNHRMQPAELRNKPLWIQAVTKAADANQQQIESWAAAPGIQTDANGVVWASVKPISGREFWLARQAQARATHRINVLWQPGFVDGDFTLRAQLADGSGRIFNFESVLNVDERNEALEIMAIEVV
jgi:head-tail adaptor